MEVAVTSHISPLLSCMACSCSGQLCGVDNRDCSQLCSPLPRWALPGSVQPHLLLWKVSHAGLGGRDEPLQDISGLPGSMDCYAGRLPRDPGSSALQRLNRASGKGQNSAVGVEFDLDCFALLWTIPCPASGAECHVSKETMWLWLRGELVCSVPRIIGADQPQLCRRPYFVLFC